jgi:hypothetical protein
MSIIKRGIQKLRELNLFANAGTIREGDRQVLRDEIISTRIYLILLITTLFILILFTSLVQTTKSVTILTPSLTTYTELQEAYPTTLTCSCREFSIPYNEFLSITISYHQVIYLSIVTDSLSMNKVDSIFNK